MDKKSQVKEIEYHHDHWLKEMDTKVHAPFDKETNMPMVGLARIGPPKTGKIIGEFQMTWQGFIYKWYAQ